MTTIYLYTYTGDPKVVDKSSYLSGTPESRSCALTQPCDIEQPSVILAYSAADARSFNYAYIPEFGRYYNIIGRETDSAGQLHLSLQSDPIFTWAADVSSWPLMISRSAQPPQGQSTYTRDPLLPLAADREVKTYKFDDEGNPFNVSSLSDTDYNFVLNVAGREMR